MFAHRIDDRTELRLFQAHDAGPLFQRIDANRDHLRRWFPWVDATLSAEDTRAFITRSRKRLAAEDGWDAGIWHEGRLAGVIGLHSINRLNRWSSLGYWIAREAEGRGIVTAACRAVLDHTFHELALHRMEIRCAPENRRSRRIPERLGFREEGTLREVEFRNGGFHDLVVYGMLSHEWPHAAAASLSRPLAPG